MRIGMFLRAHACVPTHTWMCSHVHRHVLTCTCLCSHGHPHAHKHILVCIPLHMDALPCTHTHSHAHTHTCTHVCTHAHACSKPKATPPMPWCQGWGTGTGGNGDGGDTVMGGRHPLPFELQPSGSAVSPVPCQGPTRGNSRLWLCRGLPAPPGPGSRLSIPIPSRMSSTGKGVWGGKQSKPPPGSTWGTQTGEGSRSLLHPKTQLVTLEHWHPKGVTPAPTGPCPEDLGCRRVPLMCVWVTDIGVTSPLH